MMAVGVVLCLGIRILGRLGNGRMVGHHNGLLVETPGPRSQSTMEWMRSSGQIGV